MNRKNIGNLLKTVSVIAIAAPCMVVLLCASCDSTSSSKYVTAQFVEFYKEIGCTVTAADDEYNIVLPSRELTFSLSFDTHANRVFFEVEI